MAWDSIGKSVPRPDALLQVTGKLRYFTDLSVPGMVYGAVLRSPHPHAKILHIDTSRAEKLSGVEAVIAAKDIPHNQWGWQAYQDQTMLASDKVRYRGEAVAAVAARDLDVANEALDLIKVEYEILPAVFDPLEAAKPEAPKIHDHGNIVCDHRVYQGDVEKGFLEADLIFEETFRTQWVEHAHIEPHGVIAAVDPLGRLTIWCTSARPYLFREDICKILKLPMIHVRVIAVPTGGSFGGKNEITLEPIAALLSMKTWKPVKMTFTREEEFTASTLRHPYVMRYKTGVKKNGKLIAREVEIIANTGAYCIWGDSVLHKAVLMANGPYQVDHVKVDGHLVYTNNPRSGAVRGFGVPQVAFAYETHMNNIAAELGIDPVELRRKNLLKDGDLLPCGQMVENTGIREALERAAEASRWGEERKPSALHKRRGMGVACMIYPIGICQFNNPSSAFVSINQDGTATVLAGAVDVGQGSTTVLSQIAAEELGIPIEAIEFVSADTGITPFDAGSIASRVTFIAGNAIREAAREAKEVLFQVAEEKLGISREGLEARAGRIFLKRYPERSMTLQEAAFKAYKRKGIVPLGKGSWNPPTIQVDPETGHGKPFSAYTYAAQIADVEVDMETGEVEVIEMVGANDVGTAINPVFVEGQIYGGIAMGVGYTLSEEIKIDKGVVLTDNFTNYILPTALDVPEKMRAVIVEEKEPLGPFGAKGLGESTLLPTAPAIVSAIQNAAGIKLREIPATPERILKAMRENSRQKAEGSKNVNEQ